MVASWSMLWGLPPQVRGARFVRYSQHRVEGLTPAGAGSTSCARCSTLTSRAYPRRCGEHKTTTATANPPSGLPPQVRGARPKPVNHLLCLGAYPRRCGEHLLQHEMLPAIYGLPPQVRGALSI